jgi:hypothetical protein
MKAYYMIWCSLKEKKPLAYKSGYWNGKKSDMVLVTTQGGEYFVAEMYEGVLDGEAFCNFYEVQSDFEIKDVAYWTDIASPFKK